FFFALLQLLSRAAERDRQSPVVHGGGGGDQPPCKFDEGAKRTRPAAREGRGRSLCLLAAACGVVIGRRHLSRDRTAPRQPRSPQGGGFRSRARRGPKGE